MGTATSRATSRHLSGWKLEYGIGRPTEEEEDEKGFVAPEKLEGRERSTNRMARQTAAKKCDNSNYHR